MTSRNEILSAIRKSLPEASPLPDLAGPWIQYPDPVAQFGNVLEMIGGRCVRVPDMTAINAELQTVPAYAAAKHGLAGLTKSLGNSWGRRGINVNCICPGYFETSLSHVLQDDPVRGPQILDRIPVGRWGQPDELAGLCVFLASSASNYMHGSTIAIDGGWLAR